MMRTSVRYRDEEEEEVSVKCQAFYSRAGRVRLARIWKAHNLSQEHLFSTLTAGHSEAQLRERVTDYMYAFLQARFKKQGSKNKLSEFGSSSPIKSKTRERDDEGVRPGAPNIIEEEYVERLGQLSVQRSGLENERIRRLCLDGLMDLAAAAESQNVRSSPLYRINALDKRIRNLEQEIQERSESLLLFEETSCLRSFEFRKKIKNKHVSVHASKQSQQIVSREVEDFNLSFAEPDGRSSFSSGFHDMTPSPRILESALKALSEVEEDSGRDSASSSSESRMDQQETGSYDSEIELTEAFDEDGTGDGHISGDEAHDWLGLEMDSAWTSSLVREALSQDNTISRFNESEKVLQVYRRKLLRAEVFSQDLGVVLNHFFD